jgi:hypothetical protein
MLVVIPTYHISTYFPTPYFLDIKLIRLSIFSLPNQYAHQCFAIHDSDVFINSPTTTNMSHTFFLLS